jgi:GT2 family glycosyltransferase
MLKVRDETQMRQTRPMNEINAGQGTRNSGRVYCVIPVFNRLDATLACIECLRSQSYNDLVIIVADGGSTDGTSGALRAGHPDVVVLGEGKELWWGGAARLGVDWALAHSTDDDFVLLLNNDTEFDPTYVGTLVSHSLATGGALGGLVVDARDPSKIIDAGACLDWRSYEFTAFPAPPPNDEKLWSTAALPGRGTLIPMRAIRVAGTVDDKRFPHYISDYEFTYRLSRKARIPLLIARDAQIRTVVETPDLLAEHEGAIAATAERFRALFARRSKRNVFDHYHFIDAHAPARKAVLKSLLLLRMFKWAVFPLVYETPLKYVVDPVVQWGRATRRRL